MDKIKDIFKKLNFFSTLQKITVGGFVNQLIKKIWPKHSKISNTSELTLTAGLQS